MLPRVTDEEPRGHAQLPGLMQAWQEAYDREVADPLSDVSPWLSPDLARAELEIIENPSSTEPERRAAEAALASRVGLHAAHKDRQLTKALDETNRQLATTNQRIEGLTLWLVVLTAVLALIGAAQVVATLIA